MNTPEHWILRIADSDVTWFGMNWLRPAKHHRLGVGFILLSSVVLGLPGILVGAGLIHLVLGRVELRVWLALFVFVVSCELVLHILFAHYWNQRAKKSVPAVSNVSVTPGRTGGSAA